MGDHKEPSTRPIDDEGRKGKGHKGIIVASVIIVLVIILLLVYLYEFRHHEDDYYFHVVVDVTPIENAEYSNGVLYQTSTSPGKIKLEIKIIYQGEGLGGAFVNVTGPGFAQTTYRTDSKGRLVIDELTFNLPGGEGAFIRLKVSSSESPLASTSESDIPVQWK